MSGVPAPIVCAAVTSGVALAAAAMSWLAIWRAQGRAGGRARPAGDAPQVDAAIGVLQQKLEALEQQLEELRRHSGGSAAPLPPRSGLNLDKRSQALRMHRRGDPPAQIASALGIALQEVNLLLKVHRIVLRSF